MALVRINRPPLTFVKRALKTGVVERGRET